MVRWFSLIVCLYLVFASVAFADPVTLRTRIEASGPAVTMGDVFDGAPADVAGRAIAPSPPSGQISTINMPVLQAAASAAGLQFTPPACARHCRRREAEEPLPTPQSAAARASISSIRRRACR
jgi:flagellar basal body P-ring formation protein FlgA